LLSLGGEKIYPAEVESLLQKIPSIEDAYVTQEADTIVAYLQTTRPPTEKTVSSFLRNHLPRGQIPTRIEFVANLPLGARKK
jgi:acyl-CoA synthetase (AMP-forming)/AMP-acid ligase II